MPTALHSLKAQHIAERRRFHGMIVWLIVISQCQAMVPCMSFAWKTIQMQNLGMVCMECT